MVWLLLLLVLTGTKDWGAYGSIIANKETVSATVDGLKHGNFEKTVVLVNRYDGIDLPDESCRILVFDSKPYSESLTDLYQEFCRPNSEATLMRTVRTVEQGMGRSGAWRKGLLRSGRNRPRSRKVGSREGVSKIPVFSNGSANRAWA